MTDDQKYKWVSEVASSVNEMAEFLSGESNDDINTIDHEVKEIEYGLDGILESPEEFRDQNGALTDAESLDELTNYLREFSLGTITLSGPEDYPTTTYQLDLIANEKETYWEFSPVDAAMGLESQNNYVRALEEKMGNYLEDKDPVIKTITEEYESESNAAESLIKAAS